ncbi:hypothetical protein MHO82_21065 [Vibrio sp. Of7-15]|uniref:hypothetical protein n=1 Tax=Vibrio sp. Of7-15 TaxID=2724879 RepID=UPI001EF27B3A|nr:hypothetical protein [Vibrio sp. Of7-15]MCG7499360.1 hypothetical protein [Vibrio sp. Of7-15]
MSELHQKAEDFVLCAMADDTCGDSVENHEIGVFVLSLIHSHKKGQLSAAPVDELNIKTMPVVVLSRRACQELEL